MKPYDAELTAFPTGVESYEPTPQDLSPLPYDHTIAYLARHHSSDLSGKLTMKEEQELLAIYAKGQHSSQQLEQVEAQIAMSSGNPDPQLLETKKQLSEEERRGMHAGRTLIEVNAPNAFRIARGSLGDTIRYASHYAELEDRMQNAIMGLIKALKNYHTGHASVDAPLRLIRYAHRVISNEIFQTLDHEEIRDLLGPRMSQSLQRRAGDLQKEHETADLATIAYEGDLERWERREILDLHYVHTAAHHVPLEEMKFPHAALEETWDSDGEPAVLLPEEVIANPADEIGQYIERQCIVEAIATAIGSLKNMEDRQIIRLRYGIDDGEPRSNKQIAVLLDVSPDRIQKREARTLAALRAILDSQKKSLVVDVRDEPGNTANLSVLAVKTGRTSVGPPLPGSRTK